MILETSQSILFLKFFVFGLILSLLTEVINIIFVAISKNKVFVFVRDFIFTISIFILYIYLITIFNYGVGRFYLFFAIVISFVFERITIGKLFAKLNQWLYNKILKSHSKFKNTRFGKFLYR